MPMVLRCMLVICGYVVDECYISWLMNVIYLISGIYEVR